ncbi:oxysterols receptor LXR-alpha-like [Lytechinus variegatus]|uniref:oxysterols receptor LXR-alpha-like n=1 Tax=Lytechinus variegatus TaxID=7654 RepID=UPI001BB178DF|nr:oxysterols receptor LXR-alpha-like [Lytechinus variegatus]XP_041470498.1 oxysterols receptor LXR-alpha-like [Lytechinus variegatus]
MSVPDSASADSPELTCMVCGDKANGMHYRALTCEGCKTFFRRNARHRDTLKCEMMNDGGCEMDMYTRRHCAACRMQKCISVGMQPGRLWDQNRLATRKPNKKKAKVKTENSETPPVPPEESSPAKASDLLPELSSQHWEIARLIAMAYRSAKEALPQPPPNVIPEPAFPDSSSSTSREGPEKSSSHLPKDTDSPGTSPLHNKGPTYPETPLASEKVPKKKTSPECDPGETTSSSLTLPPRTIPQAPSGDLSSTPSSSKQGAVSPEAVQTAETLPSPSTSPVLKKCECGCIIHNKPPHETEPEADLDVSSSKPSVQETSKDIPSKDQPGTSAAGPCPDDDQRSMLAGGKKGSVIVPQIMEIVVLLLRHMINFAKQLPGFQTLTSDDQATLIKGALVEYMILTSCPLYDIEKGQFNSEIWPTLSIEPDQVESAGFITVMKSVMSFAIKMQKLALTEEELGLLYALAIISPDRRDLDEAIKVEELQQPLVDALQTCVQINHPKKLGHFAKIIMLLTEVRNATEAYMDDLMTIQLSGSKLNPLLEELFSD